jgi:hypothetical protein
MAMDLSAVVQSAPQLFRDLPLWINIAQLVFYTGLATTFGGIIMKAYRGHISGIPRFGGRLVFGFLAVVSGLGLSWIIPNFSDIYIYKVMQSLFLNVIPGTIVATVVLFFSLKMISYNIFNIRGIEKAIEKLEKERVQARKVESEERREHKQGIRHPVRIGGIVLFIVFITVSLAGFQGLPNPMEEMGFTQEELNSIADQLEDMDSAYGGVFGNMDSETMQECMNAASVLQDQSAISGAEPYSNRNIETLVEEYTGESMTGMYSIQSVEGFYVLSKTETKMCLSTTESLCLCQDL